MHWRSTQGFKVRTKTAPGQCSQTDGCIGWSERGGTNVGNLFTQCIGHQRHANDISHLALICCHPESGIALEMFDRNKPFLMRQPHIIGGNIVLRIDKRLANKPARLDFIEWL